MSSKLTEDQRVAKIESLSVLLEDVRVLADGVRQNDDLSTQVYQAVEGLYDSVSHSLRRALTDEKNARRSEFHKANDERDRAAAEAKLNEAKALRKAAKEKDAAEAPVTEEEAPVREASLGESFASFLNEFAPDFTILTSGRTPAEVTE